MADTPAIVTRFAPSPTGFLHIGGARTALFNWLFARGRSGKFLLRIEDTDRVRSTPEATQAILDGLIWLGLDWDGEATSQFEGAAHHRAIAEEMVTRGTAYRCFATKEEIEAARNTARAEKRALVFRSPWRDASPDSHPDAPYVIRLKVPAKGQTVVDDAVQGTVTWSNEQLDDLILLRSDDTPTYMLAVVVDDHDMGVTHVIRGDDHLTNAARQTLIYAAMGWPVPVFAHIPLIHGPDGAKLSKRHGALGVEAYREMGYTPEALRNYLARLGWSHGDDEFFTTGQALEWFDLSGVNKAAARFDFAKLEDLNGRHMRDMDDATLVAMAADFMGVMGLPEPNDSVLAALRHAMPGLKTRARTLRDLIDSAYYVYAARPLTLDAKAARLLDEGGRDIVAALLPALRDVNDWCAAALEPVVRGFATEAGHKLGAVAQPLRAALTGRGTSPGVFDVMETLGAAESLARLEDQAARD